MLVVDLTLLRQKLDVKPGSLFHLRAHVHVYTSSVAESEVEPDPVEVWDAATSADSVQGPRPPDRPILAHAGPGLPREHRS